MSDSEGEATQSALSSPTNSNGNLTDSNVEYDGYDSDVDFLPWTEFGCPLSEETRRLRYREGVNERIGVAMIDETFVCPFEPFFAHYFPPVPDSVNLDSVVEALAGEGLLLKTRDTQSYRFFGFEEGFGVERDDADEHQREERWFAFAPLAAIGDAVRAILKDMGARVNPFRIALCSKPWIKGDPWPWKSMAYRVDGCMVSARLDFDGAIPQPGRELCSTDLVVPIVLRTCHDDAASNNLQLVVSANHIFNEDARRTFVYGISVEGQYASVWYFSRSHSMKARRFNFVKKPESLIKVLVSLFCATEEQVGFDPRITLIAGREHQDRAYLYELPPHEPTGLEPEFYMATPLLDDNRLPHLADSATRVWRVVQVASERVLDPVPGAKELVLKDAWIDIKAETEYDIQQKLFHDIHAFAAGDWRSHPLLVDFPDSNKNEFGEALANFENYFCVIQQHHIGSRSKGFLPMAPGVVVDKPDWRLFFDDKPGSVESGSSWPGYGDDETTSTLCRLFRYQRRCFYILQNECQRLDELPSLGDVLDVASQTWHALMMMFCSGWIHRDTAAGNILALQEADGRWQVKLSDLEYATRFPPAEGLVQSQSRNTNIHGYRAIPRFIPLHASSSSETRINRNRKRGRVRPPSDPVSRLNRYTGHTESTT
ncbi:other/FunK1 protein kinase, variant 2 [Coprinopsis cinerea AmutBmut pab1-1]|nr:other/FunK1 protein kinase, variant 2 [Coprinopsis cinerea AmutBmut pab1-1]